MAVQGRATALPRKIRHQTGKLMFIARCGKEQANRDLPSRSYPLMDFSRQVRGRTRQGYGLASKDPTSDAEG